MTVKTSTLRSENQQPLATIAEVARHLAVSRGKLYQLMETGYLPYVKLGRCRRITWKDVDLCVATNRIDSE